MFLLGLLGQEDIFDHFFFEKSHRGMSWIILFLYYEMNKVIILMFRTISIKASTRTPNFLRDCRYQNY